MHVVHIVRDLDVASGGPSRSVPALAEAQARKGELNVTVLFQDRGNPVVRLPISAVAYQPISGKWPRRILGGDSNGEQILHLHGLWSPNLHRSARHAQRHRIPYVVSTRGMLANWALGHKAFKKKIAWRLYQKKDLQASSYILASSEFELRDVASLLPGSKVAAIPNGCDERPERIQAQDQLPGGKDIRWAFAMGRLHPVKGYAELIEAWANLQPPAWKLAIAGPDEDGYRTTLEELILKHDLADQVHLLGEVGDAQKWSLLDRCELFLAPSKTENFGMAIAEALQSGTPVITTKGTPWRELEERDCGWWIEQDGDALNHVLGEALELDAETLHAKGANGCRLIREKYSWDQVAARTLELYRSILKESNNGS